MENDSQKINKYKINNPLINLNKLVKSVLHCKANCETNQTRHHQDLENNRAIKIKSHPRRHSCPQDAQQKQRPYYNTGRQR